jgi:6-phosphogluconolactonase (cycloisomerase 2 family)
MTNGFTLATPASGVGSTHGASLYMDTCLSVSGAIDLRNTNTIILLSDLILDNGVTLSSGGKIYGYDRAVLLDGDLTIPAGQILHIGGRIVIDGRGNRLILGKSSQLFVDAGSTLTLRNLVLQSTQNNPGNPPVKCGAAGSAASCSNLCLDNVELALANDFWFSRGQMFIHNDVAITGTSALVYSSCQPSFITSGAHLYFDVGTTFSVAPATFTDCPYTFHSTYTASNFIHMADATSMLIFNGSSFFTTPTGLRFTTGTVLFDNRVSLRSKASAGVNSTTPVTSFGSVTSGVNQPHSVPFSPDGRFIAVANQGGTTMEIFSFNPSAGISTTPIFTVTVGSAPYSIAFSPDGKFIAVANQTTPNIQIFSFSGAATSPVSIGTATTGTNPESVAWSPDGNFVAVGNQGSSTLQVFRFSGFGNPIQVTTGTGLATGTNPRAISWSPCGCFIAVANNGDSTLQIFSITPGGVPTSLGSVSTGIGSTPFSVAWSPDGRFIAVANDGTNSIQVFRFNGSGLPISVGSASTGTGSVPYSVTWSPDGRFIAVTNNTSNTLQIFSFNGYSNPISLGTVPCIAASTPRTSSWSADGRFISVANEGSNTLQVFSVNYIVDTSVQALSNSIVFGNSALGSTYDAAVRGLAGSQLALDGLINYDCVS